MLHLTFHCSSLTIKNCEIFSRLSRVTNGGAIPKCSQLHDYYLFDVNEVEKSDFKRRVKDKKKVALVVDELSDDEGRYVLDIMAVLLDFDELSTEGNCITYLLDTHFF